MRRVPSLQIPGLNIKAIAEIMGLTPYALQMKIDNETEFKFPVEIDTLANTLQHGHHWRWFHYFLQEELEFNYTFAKFIKEVKRR